MRMPGWRTMPTHNAVNVMKLLLVEDNEQLAHWLAKILEDDGSIASATATRPTGSCAPRATTSCCSI